MNGSGPDAHGAVHVPGHGDHRQGTWRTAVAATLHCLTGCAIGEILGMVLATAFGWGNAASIAVAIVLAFFFGYLLTYLSVRSVRVAVASDTV